MEIILLYLCLIILPFVLILPFVWSLGKKKGITIGREQIINEDIIRTRGRHKELSETSLMFIGCKS